MQFIAGDVIARPRAATHRFAPLERRRAAFVFGPKDRREGWDLSDGTLRPYNRDAEENDYEDAYELALVNTFARESPHPRRDIQAA